MVHRIVSSCLALCWAVVGFQAAAQPEVPTSGPFYRVEILVFAYSSGLSGITEDFLADPDSAPPGQTAELPGITPPPPGFDFANPATAGDATPQAATIGPSAWMPVAIAPQMLTPLEWSISEAARILLGQAYQRMAARPGSYERLAYLTWQQPTTLPAAAWPRLSLDELASGRLRGEVALSPTGNQNLLNLRLSVEYRPDGTAPIAPAVFVDSDLLVDPLPVPQIPRFWITQERQLRMAEIHYFDHPRFGIIVVIQRLE